MTRSLCSAEAVLQFFIGLGAMAGGAMLMLAPDGARMAMTVELLNGSPFPDFLIPGAILFLVLGVGTVSGGVLSARRHRKSGWAGMVLGLGLMIWMFVQVSLIGGGLLIQYLYFALGLAELLLGIFIQDTRAASPSADRV